MRWSHAACDSYMRETDVEAVADSGYHCLFCRPHTKHVNNPQPRGLFGPLRESAFKMYAAVRQRLNEQDGQERKEIELQKEKEMAAACKKLEQTLMKCAIKKRTDPNEKQSSTNSLGILEELHRIQTQLKEISDAALAEKSVPDMTRPTIHSVARMMSPTQKKNVCSRLWKGEELNVMVRSRSASPHSRHDPEINIETEVRRQRRHSADNYDSSPETAIPLWQPLLTEMTDKAQTLPVFLSAQSQLQAALQMVNNQDDVMDDSLRERTLALKNLYECLSQQSQSVESNSYLLISREDEHLFRFAATALGNLTTPSQSEQAAPCVPDNVESTPTLSQPKRKPKKKPEKRKEPSDSTPSGSQPGTPSKPSISAELTIRPCRGNKNKHGENTPGPSYEKWLEDERRGELATLAAILYANIEKPELKEQVNDGWDRMRIVNRLWKKASADVREKYVFLARQNRTKLSADAQRANYGDGQADGSQTEGSNKQVGQTQKEKKRKTLTLKDMVNNAMPLTVSDSMSVTTAPSFSTATVTTPQVSQICTPPPGPVFVSPDSHAFFQSPFPGAFPRPMLWPRFPPDQLRALQLALLQNQRYPFLHPAMNPRLIGHNPALVGSVHDVHGRPSLPLKHGLLIPRGSNENPVLTRMHTNLPYSTPSTSDQLRLAVQVQQLADSVPPPQPPNSTVGTSTTAEVSSNELTAEKRNDSPKCPPAVPMVGLDKWKEQHMPPTFTIAPFHDQVHRPVVPPPSPQRMPLPPRYPWVPPWLVPSGCHVLQKTKKKRSLKRKLKTASVEGQNNTDVCVELLFRSTVNDSEASTAVQTISGAVEHSLLSTKTENSKSVQDDKQVDQPLGMTASNSEGQKNVVQRENTVEGAAVKKRRTSLPKHGIEGTAQHLVVAPPEVMVCLPVVQNNEFQIQVVTSPTYMPNPSDETGSSSTVLQSNTISLPNPGKRALLLPAPAIQPTRPLLFPNIQPRRPILPHQQLQPQMFGPVAISPVGQCQPPRRQLSKEQQVTHQRLSTEMKQTVKNKAIKRHHSQETRPVATENYSVPLSNLFHPIPLKQPNLMNRNPMQVLANCYDIQPALRGKFGRAQPQSGEDFYNSSTFHSLKLSHLMRQPPPTTSSSMPLPPIGPSEPAVPGSVTELTYPFVQGTAAARTAAPQNPVPVRKVSLPTASLVSESVSKVIKPIGECTAPQPALPSPLTPTQTKLAEALRNHLLWNQVKPSHDSSLMKTFVDVRSQDSSETANGSVNPSIGLSPIATTESSSSSGNCRGHVTMQRGEQQAANVETSLHSRAVSNQQHTEMVVERPPIVGAVGSGLVLVPTVGEKQAHCMDSQSGSSSVPTTTMDVRQVGMPCSQWAADVYRQPERMETDSHSISITTTGGSMGLHDWPARIPRSSVANNQIRAVRACENVGLKCQEAERIRLSGGYHINQSQTNTHIGVSSSSVSDVKNSLVAFPVSNRLVPTMALSLQSASVTSSSCHQPAVSQSGQKQHALFHPVEQTTRKRTRPSDNGPSVSSMHDLQR